LAFPLTFLKQILQGNFSLFDILSAISIKKRDELDIWYLISCGILNLMSDQFWIVYYHIAREIYEEETGGNWI